MKIVIKVLLVIAAYLIGTFNPSYLLGKKRGMDIREHGSGNAGGSNVVILMGAKTGLLVILADMTKAFVIVTLAKYISKDLYTPALCADAVILGHMFPFYMGFRGGKGLACLGGSIIALSPLVALVLIAFELTLLLWHDYIFLLPLTLSILFPVIYGIEKRDLWVALILLAVAVPIWVKHVENMKHLREGKEPRCLSFLVNRDREIARTQVEAPDDETLHRKQKRN